MVDRSLGHIAQSSILLVSTIYFKNSHKVCISHGDSSSRSPHLIGRVDLLQNSVYQFLLSNSVHVDQTLLTAAGNWKARNKIKQMCAELISAALLTCFFTCWFICLLVCGDCMLCAEKYFQLSVPGSRRLCVVTQAAPSQPAAATFFLSKCRQPLRLPLCASALLRQVYEALKSSFWSTDLQEQTELKILCLPYIGTHFHRKYCLVFSLLAISFFFPLPFKPSICKN